MPPLYIKTPLLMSSELSEIFQGKIYLKMEAFQPSGSFKNRGIGALCLHHAKTAKCFISSSGGNSGLAVSYSGKQLNVPVKVVIPTSSAPLMIEKILKEGAEVIIHGEDWNAADLLARELATQSETIYISPFNHPLIWKGHATLIHEVYEQGIKPDAIVVAVGGGGLFCGVIQGMRDVGWRDIPVFTAETEGASSFAQSVEAKKLITLSKINTLATSLGAKTIAQQALEEAFTHPVYPKIVTDKQAVEAVFQFSYHHRVLVEPACGAALALIYNYLIDVKSYKKILVVVCGGAGVTLSLMQSWAKKVGAIQ